MTGTDGKTTTSTLIYHLLKNAGRSTALITTVGGFIGEQEINTGFHTTTPNPWLLQKLIRQVVKAGMKYLVLECTSHGLDQHRLLGTNRTIGVLTNLTHEHLDYHGTMGQYLTAKLKVFSGTKYAVINSQDEYFETIKTKLNRLIIRYGDSRPENYIVKRFPEKYNQTNAQAAIAVARLLNLDEPAIATAIANFPGVPGRLDEVANDRGIKIVVDFAHTPNALKSVLTAIKPKSPHRLIAVFGATGRRDVTKRPIMGDIVSRLADDCILTSDDCYDEDPNVIINQIKAGIKTNHGHMISLVDRQKAIAYGLTLAKRDDTLAILGKGHESVINLRGRDLPWSDTKVVNELLQKNQTKGFL
ncbi:hypothetical protein A3B57_03990 [Microgenomates group bacterium RIFCSPLOWO2_01_FULL_47_10]|nr:MAG: hypothetical protein A3B57_03990 [Microgenomates group bacterium RIFCSPLOWO2_01_FULL_47_10]